MRTRNFLEREESGSAGGFHVVRECCTMNAKHESWGQGRFTLPKRAALLAISLTAAVVGCTRAAGDSAVRRTGGAADEPFIAASGAAMEQMMKAMAIRPSGDVDRDFVAMMIPHHESAIAMAKAELRYGKNEQLRRMAQEIVVTQQQEIVAMRLALR